MKLRLNDGNQTSAISQTSTGVQPQLLRNSVVGRSVYELEGRASAVNASASSGTFCLERSDMIAFVDPVKFPEPVAKIRRFGDDERHTALFARLSQDYASLAANPRFEQELDAELLSLVGRSSVLRPARRLSAELGGALIYVKREDLSGEDRHLTISVAGQALIARRLGRKTLVTGTRDGRRGVVTAHVAARLGLKAVVYMDRQEIQRHSGNAYRTKLLGASLITVDARNLRNGDIREAALAEWAARPDEVFLITGLDAAPPPFPTLLRNVTSSIGRECKRQLHAANQGLPAAVIARNGNTEDALGVFPAFLADKDVGLVCVEAVTAAPPARTASDSNPFDPSQQSLTPEQHRAAHAILQGLEYPSVRREHEWLKSTGRVSYVHVAQAAAKRAIADFGQMEGFIPPLETAHVLAKACEVAQGLKPEQSVLAVVAEQAQQDIWDIARLMGISL